jgi:hypothetical protein
MAIIEGGLTLTVAVDGLDAIVQRLDASLFTIAALSRTVKEYGRIAQAQAVVNVSGVQVTYSGGTFVVNRVTGKLAQSITMAQVNPLAAIVKATAHYADIIESGRDHPLDMKPKLMGKTIPIRTRGMGDAHLAQTSVQGPALWAMPTQGPVKGGVTKVKRKNSKGRTSKIEFIAFRKVTSASKGWIRPIVKPRPFMLATAEKIEPLFATAIADVYAKYIEGSAP